MGLALLIAGVAAKCAHDKQYFSNIWWGVICMVLATASIFLCIRVISMLALLSNKSSRGNCIMVSHQLVSNRAPIGYDIFMAALVAHQFHGEREL